MKKIDEENRWYINGKIYYLNGNFNFTDLPEENSGEILNPEKYEVKYDLNGGVGVIGNQEKNTRKTFKIKRYYSY